LSASRRPAFLPALAILLVAGLTSACGVKGELEAPPNPAGKVAAQPAAELPPGEYERKNVFLEQSVVQSGRNPRDILPTMPPKEWSKKKVEEAPKARAVQPRATDPNERSFILDGLL
jgi:predicted small lipoprotein YifL